MHTTDSVFIIQITCSGCAEPVVIDLRKETALSTAPHSAEVRPGPGPGLIVWDCPVCEHPDTYLVR